MTDKELVKRTSKLREAFHAMCFKRNCEGCELLPIAKEFGCDSCADVWIWKKMMAEICGKQDASSASQKEEAGAAAPNESPAAKEDGDANLPISAKRSDTPPTADKMEAVQMPKWCKVGQWVFYSGCLLGKIEGFEMLTEDGSTSPTTYVFLRSYDSHNNLPVTRRLRQIQPVRFRPYSFEEAKGLIGKTIECEHLGKRTAYLVWLVQECSGHAEINGYSHAWLVEKFNATIDGVPIGVPEVDEEAERR